jgi:hypothetical protein
MIRTVTEGLPATDAIAAADLHTRWYGRRVRLSSQDARYTPTQIVRRIGVMDDGRWCAWVEDAAGHGEHVTAGSADALERRLHSLAH